MQRAQGWAERGDSPVVAPSAVGGSPSLRYYQQSYPGATITVYLSGTVTPAAIYSDNSSTPLSNPFTTDQFGHWYFYAANGAYDVQISGGGLSTPYTLGGILLFDSSGGLSVGTLTFTEEASPGISLTGQSIIYMDSTSHNVLLSQNTAAFQPIVTGNIGSNTYVLFNDGGAVGTQSNFTFIKATGVLSAVKLVGTATTTAIALANAGGSWTVDGNGLVTSTSSSLLAFQAASGGVTAKYLIANTYLKISGDTAGNAGLSAAGSGKMYFDSTLNYFLYSENGSAYARAFGAGAGVAGSNTQVQFNDGGAFGAQSNFAFVKATGVLSAVQFKGTAVTTDVAFQNAAGTWQVDGNGNSQSQSTSTAAFQTPNGGVTSKYLIATTSFTMIGDTAGNAGLSAAGSGRIYFDSTLNYFLASENGGAYARAFGGGGGSVAGSNTYVQFNDGGAFGAQANFNFVKATGVLSSIQFKGTAATTSIAFQNAAGTWQVDGNGNSQSQSTSTAAFQTPNGGVTSKYLIATTSFTVTADTAANAGLSAATTGRMYFDSTLNYFLVSENNGAYVRAFGTGAGVAGSNTYVQFNDGGVFGAQANFNFVKATAKLSTVQFVGTATTTNICFTNTGNTFNVDGNGNIQSLSTSTSALNAVNGGVTIKYLVATTSWSATGDSAANAGLSSAGNGRIYFDSTANVFKVSENGGAYVSLVAAGSVAGSNTQIQFNNSGAFGASTNFVWNNASQLLTITGSGVGTVAVNVVTGILQVTGTSTTAINVPNGGVTASAIYATTGLFANGFQMADGSGNLISFASIYISEIAAPAVSPGTYARFYADSTTHKVRLSQNGGAYSNVLTVADLVQGTGVTISGSTFSIGQAVGTSSNVTFGTINGSTITGTQLVGSGSGATIVIKNSGGTFNVDGNGNFQSLSTSTSSINTVNGGVTAKYLIATTSWSAIGDTSGNAGLSSVGNGRIYFDSTLNKFRVSENGGAYVNMV